MNYKLKSGQNEKCYVMYIPQFFKMSVQYDYTYVKQTNEKNQETIR